MSSPPEPASIRVPLNNNTLLGSIKTKYLPGLYSFVKGIKKDIGREDMKVTIDDGFFVVEVGRDGKRYYHRDLLPEGLRDEDEWVSQFSQEVFEIISSIVDEEREENNVGGAQEKDTKNKEDAPAMEMSDSAENVKNQDGTSEGIPKENSQKGEQP